MTKRRNWPWLVWVAAGWVGSGLAYCLWGRAGLGAATVALVAAGGTAWAWASLQCAMARHAAVKAGWRPPTCPPLDSVPYVGRDGRAHL